MNYGSQLKGWAIDRILQLAQIDGSVLSTKGDALDSLIAAAQKLSEFCYVPAEGATDIEQRINEIKEDMAQLQALALQPASNANTQGNA